MASIVFDNSLNWATLLSIALALVSLSGFFFNIRANQKVQIAQYQALKGELDDVKGQLGELRRLQFEVAAQSNAHDKTIKEVVKVAEANKQQLKVNAIQIPKLVSHIETLKKQIEVQVPKPE